MSIEIITTWYNEEFLAPFFMRHYSYVDRVVLFYDKDTTDNTREIVGQYPNVHIIPFRFADKMDDEWRKDMVNKQYRKAQCDWVLLVDSDEFVFLKNGERFVYDLHPFLAANAAYDLFVIKFFQMYRHENDADLDPELPAVPQRRHGDPNTTSGINALYNKPILVRSGMDCFWKPGWHEIVFPTKAPEIYPQQLLGAHWAKADPEFAVHRLIKNRKERQSQNNLKNQLAVHHHSITVKSVIDDLQAHMRSPQVF